jgi:T4 RnlA family RNA ligase
MDLILLQQMIDEKLVSVEKHPEADLFIYNYSQRVQFDKLWNDVTLQTRGLILDAHGNTIARPFGKFFNLEEHQADDLPKMPFEVFEKLDGSLGVLYFWNDEPFIATRGSFVSTQAKKATHILYDKYRHLFPFLKRNKTYLFEIIFPENRIVVDYGALNDLILLTVIDNESGEETIEDIGFPIVKRYDGISDVSLLKLKEESNKEGFVIRFQNNFRVKVKFQEYIRLHRIITGVSNITIWEYLKEDASFEKLLEKVPDEFYTWVSKTKSELEEQYQNIATQANEVFKNIYSPDRKTFALKIMSDYQHISSILFCLYSEKPIAPSIWKMVRPEYSKAFKIETDDRG